MAEIELKLLDNESKLNSHQAIYKLVENSKLDTNACELPETGVLKIS